MPYSVEGKLVVAISSRALFDTLVDDDTIHYSIPSGEISPSISRHDRPDAVE